MSLLFYLERPTNLTLLTWPLQTEGGSSSCFDKEIHISHPDEFDRNEILHLLTSYHNLDDLFDLQKIIRVIIGLSRRIRNKNL